MTLCTTGFLHGTRGSRRLLMCSEDDAGGQDCSDGIGRMQQQQKHSCAALAKPCRFSTCSGKVLVIAEHLAVADCQKCPRRDARMLKDLYLEACLVAGRAFVLELRVAVARLCVAGHRGHPHAGTPSIKAHRQVL